MMIHSLRFVEEERKDAPIKNTYPRKCQGQFLKQKAPSKEPKTRVMGQGFNLKEKGKKVSLFTRFSQRDKFRPSQEGHGGPE
jgi:hypothetical protein